MPRIFLEGLGNPIPIEALPPFSAAGDLPPVSLTFTESEELSIAEYIALGYTHYEVFCVGAAGGRGGDVKSGFEFAYSYGGGGGGGGLHRKAGLLESLPDSVAVVVGQAGVNGTDNSGNFESGLPWREDNTLTPNPNYYPATDGTDGSGSSFGLVCLASGGKGGKHAYIYRTEGQGNTSGPVNTKWPGGDGGDGGAGNRLAPGGGGAGAFSTLNYDDDPGQSYLGATLTHAVQGTWDGDVGLGGGGGRGGTYRSPGPAPFQNIEKLESASSGGHGSFNYGDTSVYGQKGVATAHPSTGKSIVSGDGGGARPASVLKYGSRAPGYNPNGIVFVRLSQIT